MLRRVVTRTSDTAEADEDDDADEEEGEGEASDSALVLKAAAKLLAGVALCAVFSDPLVGALGRLSDVTGVPPFFVGCARHRGAVQTV